MSDGLIDRLPHYGLVSGGGISGVKPGSMRGALVRADALRDMLRSPETREALAEALYEEAFADEVPELTPSARQGWLHRADAVVRVLTGEAGG